MISLYGLLTFAMGGAVRSSVPSDVQTPSRVMFYLHELIFPGSLALGLKLMWPRADGGCCSDGA
jgi:hypothetical protein